MPEAQYRELMLFIQLTSFLITLAVILIGGGRFIGSNKEILANLIDKFGEQKKDFEKHEEYDRERFEKLETILIELRLSRNYGRPKSGD